jgi:hypothetical protein
MKVRGLVMLDAVWAGQDVPVEEMYRHGDGWSWLS